MKAATKPVARRAPMKGHQPAAPVAAVSHEQAVEAFERGFRALQQRQYDRAASAFKAVIAGFPDEKEMQERARVYLSICERQAAGAGRPRSFEERMNAATVSINRGAFDDALRLLRDLASDHPQSDHVQYLLTVTHTSMGDAEKALSHLRRAIELNPENRLLSAADADLEPLRQHSAFLATLDPPPPAPPPFRRRATARRR
jgi:tetratricopeptide (TPR) repeat protein